MNPNTTQLMPFTHDAFGQVRTLVIDDKPYFVAKDIAVALGYSNHRDAIIRHCRGVVKRDLFTSTGSKDLSMIPQGDVIRLVMRSKLPAAERFESWVCDEVIPTILRTGSYTVPAMPENQISSEFPVKMLDIHRALQIEKPFPEWCRFVCDAGFTEHEDFETIGRNDVRVTYEMAKHAALSADSPQGSALRRYFREIARPIDQTACANASADLGAEIRALRDEVDLLRNQARRNEALLLSATAAGQARTRIEEADPDRLDTARLVAYLTEHVGQPVKFADVIGIASQLRLFRSRIVPYRQAATRSSLGKALTKYAGEVFRLPDGRDAMLMVWGQWRKRRYFADVVDPCLS
ncbi:MAG: hypothetical protein RJB12_946 [Pseudomonadota bacterium]|jgi:prophage antirepressor-like protein